MALHTMPKSMFQPVSVTLLTGYKKLLVIAFSRELVVSQTRSPDQTGVLDIPTVQTA